MVTNAQTGSWKQNDKRMNGAAMTALCALLLIGAATAPASDPVPAPKQKKPVALIGGTIHPVNGASIANGTILFDKGVITAVGANVTVPADAERVDVKGRHIYPGLVSAFSNLGLVEVPLGAPGTRDLEEVGRVNPNVRAESAVNPESELIPVARSGGFIVTGTAPRGGLISGLAAAMMTDGWTTEEMTLRKGIGLVITWPTMLWRQNRWSRQTKEEWIKERDNALKAIRETFAAARAYRTAKQAESQRSVPYHDTDQRWESMIPVLEGKTPVFILADELSQIQSAVAWAGEEGVRMVLVGGRDAWRVTHQLRDKKIPVIVLGTHALAARRSEPYDDPLTLPAKLKRAGIRFCIAGEAGEDNGSNTRQVPHHAATAAAYGLPKEDALRSITLSAAEILGIDDRVGSLEPGKDASLIITTGDPLEVSTAVEQVYLQGKKCDMRDKHKQLFDKYSEKYRQLKER